jgi:type IV secretion system protein VirD4
MTPTRVLVGQILIVFAIVIAAQWFATQWTADELGYQPQLGSSHPVKTAGVMASRWS